MKQNKLSHQERVRLALEHKETDRVPIAMVCAGLQPPAFAAFETYLARERHISVEEYLKPLIDVKDVQPGYVGPALAPNTDYWGVRRKPMSYGPGVYDEIAHYPLAGAKTIDDVAAHTWPATDWFDYDVLPERIAATQHDGEYCLMALNGNPFESSWYMLGFERILTELVVNPEFVHAILERVTGFFVAHFTKILQAADGAIDLVFTADDLGGQNGLLMSLDMWEAHIKPYHVRLNKTIHEYGAKVIYHTDGAVMDVVPGLIDMGIDVLQALQFDAAGMDPEALKCRYGDRLCFEGGVSVQKTLPFGSVEDVQQEVRFLINTLGRNGGYILGPSHAIQAGTPPENVAAMFDTAADDTV